jgi:NADH:ubiquinone oxidoreductase subunit F (NADH-binding)
VTRVAGARPGTAAQWAGQRLLAGIGGGTLGLVEHLGIHGPRPRCLPRALTADALTRDNLIAAARACHLRGRGGGGFPVAEKLAAVHGRRGKPVVVVNGAESEPASRKDATLLGRAPHLVLDGAVLAAEAVGAGEVVVWLPRDPARPPQPVLAAIAERERAGSEQVSIRVELGPHRYVAGNASALVNALSGAPPLPSLGPHATERGVLGRPTMVSNAETLAQLALLGRYGPAWFGQVGDPQEQGTVLVTLAGAVRRHVVVEVPFGTLLGQVVEAAAPTAEPQALLVGGYAGGWVPWPRAAGLPITSRHLRAAGATLGAGVIGILPAGQCGLVETAHLAGWLAGESSGQCGPCVNGLPALARGLRQLATGPADGALVDRLVRWSGMVNGRGLCAHPDGVALLVRSALSAFSVEINAHLSGWCNAQARQPLFPVPKVLPAPREAR